MGSAKKLLQLAPFDHFIAYTKRAGGGANVLKSGRRNQRALGDFVQTLDGLKDEVHLYKKQFYCKCSAKNAGGD